MTNKCVFISSKVTLKLKCLKNMLLNPTNDESKTPTVILIIVKLLTSNENDLNV
jgi:hypothetical protein